MNREIKIILANIIHLIHRIGVYYMIFGSLLSEKYSKYHYLVFAFVYLHWKTNENICVISNFELKLRGKKYFFKIKENQKKSDSGFMFLIINDLIGKKFTVSQYNKLTYILFIGSALISFIRFNPIGKSLCN